MGFDLEDIFIEAFAVITCFYGSSAGASVVYYWSYRHSSCDLFGFDSASSAISSFYLSFSDSFEDWISDGIIIGILDSSVFYLSLPGSFDYCSLSFWLAF